MKATGLRCSRGHGVVLGVGGSAPPNCLPAEEEGSWCIGHILGVLAQGLNGCFEPSPNAPLAS